MKIAFIVQDLVGQGVQYVTAITARTFAARGWDVDILVSPVNDDKLAAGGKMFKLPENVHLITMPNRRGSRNGWFVRQYLRHGGADFVIAESGIYSWCVVWASFGLSRKKLPKLVQVDHGNTPIPDDGVSWKYRIKTWYHYRKFHALLFVNQKSADNFKTMFPFLRNLSVAAVNNACVDEVFEAKVKLPPSHPWLMDKTCPTFVTAGAYEPYKDHMTLLRAVKIVKNVGRSMRLVIFGRGKLTDTYRAFISENKLEDFVSVGGYTDRLPAEIKASDGFVLSSNWESFGIVLAEGLACRVPCLATDAPYGPREILADGKYGRLVPINDADSMAKALMDLADGKIPVAPDESWQRYTIEKIDQRYLVALGLNV